MQENLIFDVGFHKGEDTSFYLNKGFRVVGIESNPFLYAVGIERFKIEIEERRLTLLNIVITDADGPVRFFVNSCVTEWGSISWDFVERHSRMGMESEQVGVR